ncbi:hypothetical protein ABW20_dc0100105 [Dactylellina cionopaga]|nr:hypothetical protein ABW20_dc0100105 [Dactylellina cionopaga]
MATYNAPISGGASTVVPRPSTWASIVSGQPSRSRISPSSGLRPPRNGSYANLSELGSQSGRYYNSTLSNAFNTQSKISQLPTSVPSYLEDSLYCEKLVAARYPQPNAATGPSRNSSYTSVALQAQQSRGGSGGGLKLDVKDTTQTQDDDLPTPLPTKWNENDRSGGIDISQDGLDVQFLGRECEMNNCLDTVEGRGVAGV